MKKLFMLAFANIRKTKGHTVSLFIMFFIAALLLNAGLLITFNFGSYFDNIVKDLNTSDIYYVMPDHYYNDEVEDYLDHNDNIIEMQKVDPMWVNAEVVFNDNMWKRVFLLNDADKAKTRTMTKWKFVGEHLPVEDMSIYLPYIFQLSGGYELNDKFEMILHDSKLEFTIKGFTEDVFFSSPETGFMGVYLPYETYEKVAVQLGEQHQAALVFANLNTMNKDIEKDIRDMLKLESTPTTTDITSTFFSLDRPLVEMARTMMAVIVSIMIVAFAAIIVVVCLIVVRFRIVNSIEEDMTKIGSLKAIGYTSRQIILSIVLQFTLIALFGSIIGIAMSYSTTPMLSDIFAQQSGLKWVQGFDGTISGIALVIILLIVGLVAFISSRRIKKLSPIVALRGGIVTHSFRKNHMPLNTAKGSLPFVLAVKSIIQNKKQSIMIAIIMIAVSFAQTFAVGMFYNTTVDTTTFLETPGIELSNAVAVFKPEADRETIMEELKIMEEVRKVQYIDEVFVNVDGNEISVYVMEDYSNKETDTVYEGRYPIHDNEIVLAGHLAEIIGKKVGDNVIVSMGETKEEFIVTGLSQGAYMSGMNSSVTYEGIMKLTPGFQQSTLNIYLDKGRDAGVFVEKLKHLYGESFLLTLDMDQNMEQGAGMYISIVSKVGITILVVTIAVVILVLYFVINSSVVRKKRELGIQKAVGFTTFQLMNQLSLGFLPPVIVGVCIGSVIGVTQTNALMSIAQRGMGIMKSNFIITPMAITLFGAGIIILAYVCSMLITYRVRKISAYALVTE
ncbi:ABC transporter permease [Mobilitalea sibirica]|uniref:ABC transporter permease n=1 Tax=Mobilitalea sibirica TaxID=1462919 RepID=A0A8J7H3L3_9FIRM|nr:ABC transporter permease [Mobilitalea sibirica]